MIVISVNGADIRIHAWFDLLVWATLFSPEVVPTFKKMFTFVCTARRVKSLIGLLLKTT